ncbi:hypothetical protein C8A00DRAFT_38833, partial [Chaetomidium leptoderma]
MNPKRTYQDENEEDPAASLPKRPRTFDSASNGGIYPNHDAYSPLVHRDYTIAWICALHLELAASRAMLDEEHPLPPNQAGDDNTYVLGRIDQHNVVMTCLPGQYGTNNAAIVATNLKRSFPSIRATLMVGIGGGSPSQADLYLGDVVVGTRVMQYDMGKMIAGGLFQETADAKTPAWLLSSAVSALRSKHRPHRSSSRMASLLRSRLPNILRPSHPDRLFQASYEHPLGAPTCIGCDLEKLQPRGARLSDEPRIHYGVIASGNRVMKDGKARDDIAQRISALCFEMEAAGMMDNLQCLPIRGICDYSDSHKNKEWQDYAAATAAAYARELLEGLPPSSRTLDRTPTYITDASQPDTAGIPHKDPEADEATRRYSEKAACLRSLGFRDIDARLHDIAAAYSGTCDWLFSTTQFQKWRDRADLPTHNGVLWINGKPGAGKSTLMKHALRHCEEVFADHLIVAYFFNARGEILEKTPLGMLQSIVHQLLNKDDTLYERFRPIYEKQKIYDEGEWVWPRAQLEDFIRSIINKRQSKPLLLLVDALDECDDRDVRDVVGFLESLSIDAVQAGVTLRICLSSRHYPNVSMRKFLELTLEMSKEHGRDIATYIAQKLDGHDDDIKAKVREKAGGIFMWVVIMVSLLNKAYDEGRLEAMREALEEVPADLEEVFNKLLSQDDPNKAETVRMLQWVLLSRRPLKPEELFFAVLAGTASEYTGPWNRSKITGHTIQRRITASSKGLIEVRTGDTASVQFIHLSVNDFLFRNQRLQTLDQTLQPDPIKVGADVNAQGGDFGNALQAASYGGHAEIVRQLLERRADVNAQGGHYSNALQAASYGGHAEIVQQLLEHRAGVNTQGGRFGNALQAASYGGHAEVVRQLLEHRADVNAQGGRFGNALQAASYGGHAEVVRQLLEHRAGVNAQGGRFGNALQAASDGGHAEIVRQLLEHRADVNAQGGRFGNALQTASAGGHAEI